jgi:hypothetical protein
MSDIFLSYARGDLSRVKPVVDALEAHGWSVWWDPAITPGQTWDDVIQAALAEARCVVVLWSLDAVQSYWVRTEANDGQRRSILIPALLDDVEIPLAFRRIQAANLVGWSGALPHAGFEELVRAVEGKLAAPAARNAAASVAAPAIPQTPRVKHGEQIGDTDQADSRQQQLGRVEMARAQPSSVVAVSEGRRSPRLWMIAAVLGLVAVVAIYLVQASKGRAPAPPVSARTRVNPKRRPYLRLYSARQIHDGLLGG